MKKIKSDLWKIIPFMLVCFLVVFTTGCPKIPKPKIKSWTFRIKSTGPELEHTFTFFSAGPFSNSLDFAPNDANSVNGISKPSVQAEEGVLTDIDIQNMLNADFSSFATSIASSDDASKSTSGAVTSAVDVGTIDILDLPNSWVPDTSRPAQFHIVVTTVNGEVFTSPTYNAVYDPNRSAQYLGVDSFTTPRAYVAVDMRIVQQFGRETYARTHSAADILIVTEKPILLTVPDTGQSFTYHNRSDTSGIMDFLGTNSFRTHIPIKPIQPCYVTGDCPR
ncbi:MAG: hypothetical protein ACRD4L_06520 [Pyrinomonadaceae bacterium]